MDTYTPHLSTTEYACLVLLREDGMAGRVQLNGLDPEAYLRDLLGRTADHPINRIAELLSGNIGRSSANE